VNYVYTAEQSELFQYSRTERIMSIE